MLLYVVQFLISQFINNFVWMSDDGVFYHADGHAITFVLLPLVWVYS